MAVAIAYAARHPPPATRHPQHVAGLAPVGGFAVGWRRRGDPAELETRRTMLALLREAGRGGANSAFRRVMVQHMWPDGAPDHARALDELQVASASPENAARLLKMADEIYVADGLPCVRAPTLVLHCREDAAQPVGLGLAVARGIPGARFVELASRNQLPVAGEAAWVAFLHHLLGPVVIWGNLGDSGTGWICDSQAVSMTGADPCGAMP